MAHERSATSAAGELDLKFQVFAKIAKPVAEVFDAVYNPKKLSGYFTTGGASGPLDEGTTVTWDFADFPGAFPVHVRKVERNRLIALEWKANDGDYNTHVRMEFESLGPDATLVRISESGWQKTPKGLEASYGNCMGWSQMLCCLKVFVEQGTNLRAFMY
ncbi:SRPBCC family protein [Archangium lansingense]|uniref:SRPBCC family protein n=1 Tax=Archangium lansingense TaxID=2995310 RepID=A0ABT4AGC7_9BACT|nr:SRPBCC family protein [Archangium lansinium]MCY1080224.1 SRPBCC family protein [Archangium lansinium]